MSADLVGRWSIEHGYHSAMEDEELVFRADGTGWCEWVRPGLSEFTVFRWVVLSPGSIRVVPHRAGRSDSAEIEEHEVPSAADVDYVVVEETRPLYRGMEVLALRIGLPFAVFPHESYGLSDRETPDGDRPYLPWLDEL
jgi:hypothetical protein